MGCSKLVTISFHRDILITEPKTFRRLKSFQATTLLEQGHTLFSVLLPSDRTRKPYATSLEPNPGSIFHI